ncbi:MAG TPA: hypothetical protein VE053_09790 [Allosphingosinicella sp.]|nr:hypothetical protein [Allosphingosinicella sp.]
MKLVMMAAALMLGTAAIAQTTTQEEPDTSAETTDTTTDTATDATTPPDATTSIPPPASTTPTDTSTDMAPPAAPAPAPGNMSTMRTGSGQAVAAGNTAPETDARGIRVVSDPATAPAGYNEGARTVPAGSPMTTVAAPTPTASGPLPPCTRTVTDRCTQTYERGRAR